MLADIQISNCLRSIQCRMERNPPEKLKQFNTVRPDASEPTFARLSRWSRKNPVFCPLMTSA